MTGLPLLIDIYLDADSLKNQNKIHISYPWDQQKGTRILGSGNNILCPGNNSQDTITIK